MFEITVKAEAAVETVAYTFDFGTVQKTGYGAGDLVFSNTNGDAFTLNKDIVQIFTSTFAPWIESAGYLVLAPISTAKLSFIEFDFTAATYANASKIEFDFAVSNQNNHDQTVALAGSSFRVEKLDGENWVTVGDDVFSQLTKGALTTVSINITGAGTYRLVYEAPAATSTKNTDYAIGVDNLKIYVLN